MTSLSENTVVTTSGGLVEVARVSRTSNYSIDSTSVSTAANIFATNATFVGDGSDYEIEFYAPEVYTALNAGAYVYVYLTDGGSTSLGAFGAVAYGDGTRAGYGQMYGKYILPTTAGTVYSLNARGTYYLATGTMLGGNGQASGRMPIYMTVRKLVQASQFIVPLASAPLVTSLPSTGNIDGQEVRYLVDDTNGTLWNLRWRASANRWEPISGFESDRNRIINGAMLVDQRRSFSAANSQTDAYVSDRFHFLGSGGGNANVQTVTNDGPTGVSTNSAKITVATQDTSLAAGDYYLLRQGIEGNVVSDLGFGSSSLPITLSFYVKSSVTGLYGGSFRNPGDTRCYVFTYNINSANTWERKIIPLTVDNTGTYGTGTNNAFFVVWSLGHGSGATSSTTGWQAGAFNQTTGCTNLFNTAAATWQLSGVQLELGPTATPFQRESIVDETSDSQRYFYKTPDVVFSNFVFFNSGNISTTAMPFPVRMRANPIISYDDGSGNASKVGFFLANGNSSTNNAPPSTYVSTTDSWRFGAGGALTYASPYTGHMYLKYEANAEIS